MRELDTAYVVAMNKSSGHGFSKTHASYIQRLKGPGAEGDAHAGESVQHRSQVAKDPTQPNLRQVHLLSIELIEEMRELGFVLAPGDLGKNITTRGIELQSLTAGTRIAIGDAEIETTGLRNPCQQIEQFRPGLLKHVVFKFGNGTVVRRAGIMGVIAHGGTIRINDSIDAEAPDTFQALEAV